MNEIENKHHRTVLVMGISLVLCVLGSFTLGRYPVSLAELLGVCLYDRELGALPENAEVLSVRPEELE